MFPALSWGQGTDGLVEYLYIDANEDQASGGHVALRIDQDVFHFQYEDGLLVMARDNWAEFQLSYRGYQNRNIQALRLELSQDTYKLVRKTFVRRHLTQSRQLALLGDTGRDLNLVRALSDGQTAVELPGFGYFDTGSVSQLHYRALRQAVEAAHGVDFLHQRREALVAAIAEMPVHAIPISDVDFTDGHLPRPGYAFNRHYSDIVAALLALDVLDNGYSLSAEALSFKDLVPGTDELSSLERAALELSRAQLQDRVLELLTSRRPDWGHTVLLGLARLQAMELSLQQGRWVLLDILDADAAVVEIGKRTRKLLPDLLLDAHALWLQQLVDWLAQPGWDEARYSRLEAASANWLELRRLTEEKGGEWRIRVSQRVPRGMGLLYSPPRPTVLQTSGQGIADNMRQSLVLAQRAAKESQGYSLLSRNCVSELFNTLESAMATASQREGNTLSPDSLNHEFQRRFGGVIDPSPIPFVSARQVRESWHIELEQELPSLRRIYAQQQAGAGARLRESNTLTSTAYHPSDQDSFFIFFTDGNALWRPAQGLVNLTAALGATMVGVIQWPFDGGKTLTAGARGALFSLPELGFQNIRKGTNNWISPQLRGVDLQGETGQATQ